MCNDKYGSCGIPWWEGKIIEPKPADLQLDEIKKTIVPAFQNIVDALIPAIQHIIDGIVPLIGPLAEQIVQEWKETLKLYPNKRVVHLALHHPKARVRKKNMNRIIKYMSKNGGDDDGRKKNVHTKNS